MRGSCGLYAYRHRKKYYIKFNPQNSYPSGLGTELVNQIPVDAEGFKAWLESKRTFFDAEEERLRELDPDVKRVEGYNQVPSDSPPLNSLFIPWTYIMDLDYNAFIIDMELYFPLDNIPRGDKGYHWIGCFGHDASGDRCMRITTPREFAVIPSRPAPEPSTQGLAMYHELESNLKLLPTSEWLSQPPTLGQEFALDAAAELVKLHYYWFYLSQTLELNDAKFRNLALGLLSMTAEGFTCTASKKYTYGTALRDGLIDFATWMEGKSDRPPDASKWFWLRGVLVHLTSHLDVEANRKASVGLVVSAIQELKLDYCFALLFSINHVVVVKVADGVVHESRIIEILAALPNFDWKDRLIAGLTPLAHVLRLPALMDIERVEPGATFRPFPMDVMLQILEYADNGAYDQCSKLSKAWRRVCKRNLRVGPYTVIGRDNDAFIARMKNGPITRIKLFWTCDTYLESKYIDGANSYEVYLKSQRSTQADVGAVGSKLVRMRVRPAWYHRRGNDIRVIIAEKGTDVEHKVTTKVRETMEEVFKGS
ncbi:hypothetical protein BD410DRAFT_794557 [Rickenella mellea]|uniref:F-box domain-containing protein n=1 Tax=Rickenella mellea TaxID=50990 RepID=A0A4Y7PQG1_9AGAM|nr:hypothetical protein BD410DRAFT_794557 [Rickenella mellea]